MRWSVAKSQPDTTVVPVVTLEARLVRSPTVAQEDFENECVLYDDRDGAVHVLNATAVMVWNSLDGDTSLAELVADLAAAFDVSEAIIAEQVLAMAGDLADKGLLMPFASLD